MRLATVAEIRRIEDACILDRGLGARDLMLNAGRAFASALLADVPELKAEDVLVVCGPGNNGGDGFVIARELRLAGVLVRLASIEPENENELRREVRQGLTTMPLSAADVRARTLIIDALYGTGLSRDLPAVATAFFEKARKLGSRIFAVDGPSGLDFDRGVVLGGAPVCETTYTFGLAKPGFFVNEGPAHCGRVKVLDIGFPKELLREEATRAALVTAKVAARLLPPRAETGNKSRFGRVLIAAGHEGMAGAGLLAATAAARAGTGYVTWATRANARLSSLPPDFLTLKWAGLTQSKLESFDGVVFGPGVGIEPESDRVLTRLLKCSTSVVLDADGLSLLNDRGVPSSWILTPHAGEAARLLGITAREVENDRLGAARELTKKIGGVIVLKGFRTVVDDGRRSWICHAGNVALAKAGSGDVLAGLIGGLRAQGLSSLDAAVLGAWIHGACADLWVRRGLTNRTLMASDLPGLFGRVMSALEKRRGH